MARNKPEVITFKVDAAMSEALKGVANRSEFVRAAVQAALEQTCPLCLGTGLLSGEQKQHWESFTQHHRVQECKDCHERHLVCVLEEEA